MFPKNMNIYILKFLISSIGSLGENQSESRVSDVLVNGARLSGTTNGVRIKSWQVKFSSSIHIHAF